MDPFRYRQWQWEGQDRAEMSLHLAEEWKRTCFYFRNRIYWCYIWITTRICWADTQNFPSIVSNVLDYLHLRPLDQVISLWEKLSLSFLRWINSFFHAICQQGKKCFNFFFKFIHESRWSLIEDLNWFFLFLSHSRIPSRFDSINPCQVESYVNQFYNLQFHCKNKSLLFVYRFFETN